MVGIDEWSINIMNMIYNIMTGWWYTYPFVSWDDDIPNIWKNKIHVPNHQQDI